MEEQHENKENCNYCNVLLYGFSLIGCGRKLKSPEDLIAKARKEITAADADTIEVQL